MLSYPDIPEINKLISPRTNQYLESVGLLFYAEHETMRNMLIKDALSGDKLIYGYFGYPYVCRNFGDMRVIARTFPDGVRYDDAARFEITYKSSCIWQVRIEFNEYFHSWPDHNETLVRSMDRNHLAMINILDIDVLPSIRKGEIVKLRMTAFATDYRIFDDEEKYVESIKPGLDGRKPLMDSNTIMPAGQFVETYNTRLDDLMLVHGTVKRSERMSSDILGEGHPFLCLCIDTQFGELPVAVPCKKDDKTDTEQYVGKTLDCLARLCGDAAVNEYADGIRKDAENNLRLVAYTLEEGKPERLRAAASPQLVYLSECSGKSFKGLSDCINYIDHMQLQSWKSVTECRYGVVTGVLSNAGKAMYPIGTRCALVKKTYEDQPYGVLFVDTDDAGLITKICLSKVEHYQIRETDQVSEQIDAFRDCTGQSILTRKIKTDWPENELIVQKMKSDLLSKLRFGYSCGRFDEFISLLADNCVFESECRNEKIEGTTAVAEYLCEEGKELARNFAFPRIQWVESDEGEALLLLRQRIKDAGILVSAVPDAEGKAEKIRLFSAAEVAYRVVKESMTATPVKEVQIGNDEYNLEEDVKGAITIPELYYDELRLFFEMEYSDFDPREDYHMGSDNWVDILKAWRDFYEADNYDALCDRLFKGKEESFEKYPKYAEWFKSIVKTIWDRRQPYGWEMLIKLENWLNQYKDHEWIYLI